MNNVHNHCRVSIIASPLHGFGAYKKLMQYNTIIYSRDKNTS